MYMFTDEAGKGGLSICYSEERGEITVDRSGMQIRFNEQEGESRTRPLETGLSVKCMDLCDLRSGKEVIAQLPLYDMVILGGGHVPTQKRFFDEIGLREALRGWDGIVMGISAGSMNCADLVYAQPEMPGEALDPSYQKFIRGLGLTDVNVLPHYQAVKDDRVDGLRLMEEITYPDSAGRTFYAIVDGSYVLQTKDRKEITPDICTAPRRWSPAADGITPRSETTWRHIRTRTVPNLAK